MTNTLGNDSIERLNRWRRVDEKVEEEYKEIYYNTRAKNNEKTKHPTLEMIKKLIDSNKMLIAGMVLSALAVTGAVEHNKAENIIYQEAVDQNLIPDGISIFVASATAFTTASSFSYFARPV